MAPLGRSVSRFFPQLPGGGVEDFLTRIDLTGGEFDEGTVQGIAMLAHKEQMAIVEHGDDHSRSLMFHVLAQAFLTIRQAHPITANVKQLAAKNLGTLERLLAKVIVNVVHRGLQRRNAPTGGARPDQSGGGQRERSSAKAHSDISACGKIPSSATASPFAESRIFISSGASIGVLHAG